MIPKIPFGRSGHLSSRALFGAAALGTVTQQEADQTLELLLEYGINHIDVAASYGDAELRVGPWMKKHRDDFFLATKSEERSYQGAKDQLHQSLERLQVDQIDLWQMHFLVDEEGWQTAMGPGGALEAFIEARQQGLVRFLGVTGHGYQAPNFHLRSLERFDFDSVLLPYSPVMMEKPAYADSFEALIKVCEENDVAVQTIKAIVSRPWKDETPNRATWYKPLEDQTEIDTVIHWVLAREGFFINTPGDIHLLPRALDAIARFDSSTTQTSLAEAVAKIQIESLFK